jgi:rRNA maturation endonuclease Nob1
MEMPMRCNNCGWDNDPNSNVCSKCGHPLPVEEAGPYRGINVPNYERDSVVTPRPTVLDSHQVNPVPRPTRIANNPMPQDLQLKATVLDTQKKCPHCGYPIMNEAASCPSCGLPISEQPMEQASTESPSVSEETIHKTKSVEVAEYDIAETVKCEKCGTEVSIEFSFCPKCGERIHLPTVRSIRHKPKPAPEPPKPHCRLTLIPEEDEQMDKIVCNDYEGASIILNRDNTEQDNRTITSKEQAELIFEDDKWYILNRSELGSTYLEVNRKLELQQDDIILLGDRRFKFEVG